MKYTYLFVRVFAPAINLSIAIVNLIVRRDKNILLFGSWMGEKFADNTRFFYQYLEAHKSDYHIKKIIWVTNNERVYDLLKEKNSEVYMMHSWKSIYYHLKAGVHCICNLSFPVKGYDGDIMGQLSGSAVKINMLHGVALKAGKSTGLNIKNRGVVGKVKYFLRNNRAFCALFTPGHWDKAYHLSTSKECTRRDAIFCGVDEKWFLESGYPRNCYPMILLDEEIELLKRIRNYEKKILYVPTFREKRDVPHPLDDLNLREFLWKHNCLWIEKPHPATSSIQKINEADENYLFLPPEFDINVLIPRVTLVITDYSSVSYDAYAFDIPVLFYSPDYRHYMTKERGFLCDYRTFAEGFYSESTEELIKLLEKALFNEEYQKRLNNKTKKEKDTVLRDNKDSCREIAQYLHERLGIL